MGREVKRVALDFDWPVGVGWPGYHGHICAAVYAAVGRNYDGDACEVCKIYCKHIGAELDKYDECPAEDGHKEPPPGDGYQMWETTSEGSPISPVFKTPEELARWLVDNGASSFGSDTATYDQWLGMIRGPGWAPSAAGYAGKIQSGVAFIGDKENEKTTT